MNFWAKLENATYKKNQFKAQIVYNRLKGYEIDWVDRMENFQVLGRNNYLQQILEKKNYKLYYKFKIIIYSHTSRGSVASI